MLFFLYLIGQYLTKKLTLSLKYVISLPYNIGELRFYSSMNYKTLNYKPNKKFGDTNLKLEYMSLIKEIL